MNVTDPSKTQEGTPVEIGMRVIDYNWDLGTVESGPDSLGWYTVKLDKGGSSYMDGTRLSTGPVARRMGFEGEVV